MSDLPVCYYDLLEVNRDASDKEIKLAYRKLALKWHPDKNPDNVEEATIIFSKIQHAHEVLSDVQERAWYDENRESILFGTKEGSNFDLGVSELMHYFSCLYTNYSDNPNGFYTVHRILFEKLAKSEHPENVGNVPGFGNSSTPYSEISLFYNFWQNFSTTQDFCWYDEYAPSQALDRKSRRYMEKENKKLRENGKKAFNSTVRRLADFIMKRDPRVQSYIQEKKIENEMKDKQRKELIQQQRKKDLEMKSNSNFISQEWAMPTEQDEEELRLLEEEWKIQDTLVNSKKINIKQTTENDVDAQECQDLYCIACEKELDSFKDFEHHKLSKKHLKMVERLRNQMLNEDSLFDSEIDFNKSNNIDLNDNIDLNNNIDNIINETQKLNLNTNIKKQKKKNKNKSKKVQSYYDDYPMETILGSNKVNESEEEIVTTKNSFSFDFLDVDN